MLVLTPKYGSQIDLDLLKKQKKEPLVKHRNDIIYLTYCKDINEAYLTFLDNKDKYVIGYKPKEPSEIDEFVYSLGEIDTLDVSWIDVSELESLNECFSYCKAKHIAGLEKWDVSNVKYMSRMFEYCENLESVGDISRWDVNNVKLMSGMFKSCENLESIGDISGWDVSNVLTMHYMFLDCEKLKSVGDLERWNVYHIENIRNMFSGCKNLESIGDISRWDVSNVKDLFGMHLMFMGCQKLENVGDLNHWNVSNNVYVLDMFKGSAIMNFPSWY